MTNTNSLESVVRFLGTKAKSYEDVAYEPTFKSSAMFPITCGKDMSVSLSFMNYWKHKNEIEPVSCVATIRSRTGDTLKRTYFRVEDDVYNLGFPDQVSEYVDGDGSFVGSCELEVLSIEDLKFPYPAVSVFCETPRGVASVHMASRVFHDVQDMDKRLMTDVQESGFDIHSTDSLTPFFCFTNGPRTVVDAKASVTAFNAAGEEKLLEMSCGDLKPYQTVFVYPDLNNELREFLGGRVGFCKVKYDSFGIFPRLLCGNVGRDMSEVGMTHSYYDVSGRREYLGSDSGEGSRGPFRAIPLLFGQGIDVDLNFYPIYSPGEVYLRARIYDRDGELLADLDDLGSVVSPGNRMVNLRVRDVMQRAEVPLERSSLLSIEGATRGPDMPSRINYGVNYYVPEKLGTNINISMHQEVEFASPRRSYRWLPVYVRPGLKNYVLLAALSNRPEDDFVAQVKISLFGAEGLLRSETVEIKNQSSISVPVDEMLSGAGGEEVRSGIYWCVLDSESAYIDAYYLNVSEDGHVGGDHSF